MHIKNRCVPIASTLLGTLVAVGVCGCGFANDCSVYVTCPEPEPEPGAACVADPAAGPADEACGVFVSASLGKDANPGTRTLPLRTMKQAIALALSGSRRVYACAEAFPEPVIVPSGTQIWGGLDCRNGWVHLGGAGKTTITPVLAQVPLTFVPGEGTSTVADLRAVALNAVQPSGSSIAAMVMPDAVVEILRSELVAADGAPGRLGEDSGDQPAATGTPGSAGGTACESSVIPGAPSVVTECEGIVSIGGRGGDGTTGEQAGEGLDGEPAPIPNPGQLGNGGDGQGAATSCSDGSSGADGAHGQDGLGAVNAGQITLLGWEGQNGKDGARGLPGQGGGGGGGARGGFLRCDDPSNAGASGGSGGGGGCGGNAGKGGGYGGASMGLLSLGGTVAVRDTTIVTGRGGDGGAGGLRQLGGAGGTPGSGGAAVENAPNACHGGAGGKGGHGGHGGGGLGGPSIGIAYVLGQTLEQERLAIEVGSPGKGGASPWPGGAGADGVSGDMFAFPLEQGKVLPGGGLGPDL